MSGADDQRAAEVLRRYLEDPNRCDHPTDEELAALLAGRDRLRAELDRLHSWDGLMSLLDEHWPVDIFRADPMEDAADPGPRIVALLRWVDRLRAELAKTRAEQRESRDIVWWMGTNLGWAYTAGDALADVLTKVWNDMSEARPSGLREPVDQARREWRSVRGDARTAPAADVRDPASETHRTSAAPDVLAAKLSEIADHIQESAIDHYNAYKLIDEPDLAETVRQLRSLASEVAGGSLPASTDGGEQ